MQVNRNQHQLDLPQGTREKLDAFRRRVWQVKIAEGLLAAAFGLLLSYLVVLVLDRFFDTPWVLRVLLLAVGAAGLGIAFPLKLHRWVWRTRRLDQLARLLKYRWPRLSDRMLGIIELASSDTEQERSRALCQAAFRQVDQELQDRNFDDAVPHPRHRQWSWAAGVPLAISILGLIAIPAASRNAMARWLMPWRPTPRYTFAQLESLPASLTVPYAEPFSLQTSLTATTAWSPSNARARLGDQPAVTVPREERQYNFALPPQKDDVPMQVEVGDARRTIAVEPKMRPELTSLIAHVTLPDYLLHQGSLTKDARGGTLSVVQGSRARLVGTASRELAMASMNGNSQQVEGAEIWTEPVLVEGETPLQVELGWSDAYGLTSRQPFVLSVQGVEDQPPTVLCSQLDRQQVVLHDQVLSFEVSSDDDFGVREIGIQWQGIEDPLVNPEPVVGEMLVIAGSPEQNELSATAVFSAKREGIAPQTLQLRLFATDYLPGRERVYSPPFTLFVLTPSQHAAFLAEQMRRWSRQAQAVYETENQLYETNKELRELSSEELDSPKARQRIESQAAAELTNARRLSALTAAGRSLLQEAARNDEFNAQTMENMAQMVVTLEEMAQQRMPSVAELLKQASAANNASASPAKQPADDASVGAGDPAGPSVGNNRSTPSSEPGNQEESAEQQGDEDREGTEPQPPTPSINDVESGFNKPSEQPSQPPSSPSSAPAALGLPTTTVMGGGESSSPPPQEKKPSEAKEKLDQAINEQEGLLEAFSKIAEELQQILDNLEGSTFVKRLKAASRRQLDVASELNASLAARFGRRAADLSDAGRDASRQLADREIAESENLMTIQQDLEAYYHRVQQGKYRTIMLEMNELAVSERLKKLAELVQGNFHGKSIAHAEYWADTFDRWAEQLVGPGPSSSPPSEEESSESSPASSIPPEVILEVMKILEKEVGLREETRAAEQVRSAVELDAYTIRATDLSKTQQELADRVEAAASQLLDLQEEGMNFPQVVQLLTQVEVVMREAEVILARPETGPEPIAAESEAIELLLQTQRMTSQPKSSSSAGDSPNGGGEGDTEVPALALLGAGTEANAGTVERETSQATGTTGASYPAEFRAGLDIYFGELEK